jgi:hypothetical protein
LLSAAPFFKIYYFLFNYSYDRITIYLGVAESLLLVKILDEPETSGLFDLQLFYSSFSSSCSEKASDTVSPEVAP